MRSCNICGSTTYDLYLIKDGIRVVKCSNCGLIYTYSDPEENDRYSARYFLGDNYEDYIADIEAREREAKERLDFLNSQANKKGKLIEVGCAAGFFLAMARRDGWSVEGTDISAYATNYAREKFNIEVFTGYLRDRAYPDNYFEAAVLWHTLEHCADPKGELREINRLLKPEGILALEVPNIESLSAQKYKERWYHFVPQYHLYHFSPDTLGKLLKKTNFKIIRAITVSGGVSPLPDLRKKRIPVDFVDNKRWQPLKRAVKKVVWRAVEMLGKGELLRVAARKVQ